MVERWPTNLEVVGSNPPRCFFIQLSFTTLLKINVMYRKGCRHSSSIAMCQLTQKLSTPTHI